MNKEELFNFMKDNSKQTFIYNTSSSHERFLVIKPEDYTDEVLRKIINDIRFTQINIVETSLGEENVLKIIKV